ncbi:MAG: hypothetical protein GMKNLPBB_01716 [Myxococcota bacterium]|nr:hypothetical protein [Myxococcota bacterium]
MEPTLSQIIDQVGKDKGIDRRVLVEALESAMLTAARRKYGPDRELQAMYNEELGKVELFEFRKVVETIQDPEKEILLEQAHALDPGCQIGDELGMPINSDDLGRIAAQTAKQVIIQKVRDAEREMVYNEYKDREGELVTGTARRFEKGNIIVDLGRAEAILPVSQQTPRETYRAGERVQAYVVNVDKALKGPQIVLSRIHPGLLMKLFEKEVPEIAEGIVRIESAAREPGSRAKIAVSSRDSAVDPVGACVGMKGSRVQAVVQELRGEKIDIVPWSPDPARFVCNALAPAEPSRVLIDEGRKTMEVIVPDDQLSLAIGRRGQNVRLAAQLTGWRLDITSEAKAADARERALRELSYLEGVGETMAEILYEHGFRSLQEIVDASDEDLIAVPGMSEESVERYHRIALIALERWREDEYNRERAEAEAAAAAAAAATQPAPPPAEGENA